MPRATLRAVEAMAISSEGCDEGRRGSQVLVSICGETGSKTAAWTTEYSAQVERSSVLGKPVHGMALDRSWCRHAARDVDGPMRSGREVRDVMAIPEKVEQAIAAYGLACVEDGWGGRLTSPERAALVQAIEEAIADGRAGEVRVGEPGFGISEG